MVGTAPASSFPPPQVSSCASQKSAQRTAWHTSLRSPACLLQQGSRAAGKVSGASWGHGGLRPEGEGLRGRRPTVIRATLRQTVCPSSPGFQPAGSHSLSDTHVTLGTHSSASPVGRQRCPHFTEERKLVLPVTFPLSISLYLAFFRGNFPVLLKNCCISPCMEIYGLYFYSSGEYLYILIIKC